MQTITYLKSEMSLIKQQLAAMDADFSRNDTFEYNRLVEDLSWYKSELKTAKG